MKSRLLIASAVIIAAMMLMSPFVMNGEDNVMLGDVEGGVCIDELSVVDGVLCDSSGQAFDATTPILIDDENDLKKLSELVSSGIRFRDYFIYLTSDIKMTEEFVPIGGSNNAFQGTFDGQNFTISNLIVNVSIENETLFAGLFGYIERHGAVYNLGLIDTNVSAALVVNDGGGEYAYAGGIVGRNYGTVVNCYNTGNVIVNSEVPWSFAGGIAGYNSGTVQNCYNTGSISAISEVYSGMVSCSSVGGIVGYGTGTIQNCHNVGDITAHFKTSSEEGTYIFIGGIIGYNTGVVQNCYNTEGIDKYSENTMLSIGGIAGYNVGTVQNCYNEGNIIGETTDGMRSDALIGGIIGWGAIGLVENCYNTGNISAKTISNADKPTSDALAGGILGYSRIIIRNCYNTGDVTGISETTNAHVGGIAGYTSVPEDSSPYIQNCYNTGNITACSEASLGDFAAYAGGIAGWNEYKISDCYNLGDVESISTNNNAYAGGIAAHTRTAEIEYCCNVGDITASVLENKESEETYAAFAGGIAGKLSDENEADNSYINQCCNLGNVSAYSAVDASVGGIAGYNKTIVRVVYNTGNIYAEASGDVVQVGGIVGDNEGSVWYCYNIGNVSASGNAVIGSVIGNCKGSVTALYYLAETADAGIGQCANEDVSVSLTSEEMKGWNLLGYGVEENNLNLDIIGERMLWTPDIFNVNNGYPIISGIPCGGLVVGEMPSSAIYILINDETLPAENYLKLYMSKTPAVNLSLKFEAVQYTDSFVSLESLGYTWMNCFNGERYTNDATSFTPSEYGTYTAFVLFKDKDGKEYEYVAQTRTVVEAVGCTISFDVPEDAEVTVKDSSDNVVSAESDGTYLLEAGEYTYTVVKEGYKTVEKKLTVGGLDQTVTVALEERTNTIYYIIAAIVVILVVVAIAYFITKKK